MFVSTLLKLSWPERDSISLTSSIKVGKRIKLIKRKWKPTLRFSEGKFPAISGETAKHRLRGGGRTKQRIVYLSLRAKGRIGTVLTIPIQFQ